MSMGYAQALALRAQELSGRGISILPTYLKGKNPHTELLKKIDPAGKWSGLKTTAVAPDAAARLFMGAEGSSDIGLGVICGAVSGGLEMIDCDTKNDAEGTLMHNFKELLQNTMPGLLDKMIIQQSQSGGWHLIYRCAQVVIPGNMKLAKNANGEVLLETRGEGGYFLADPTTGYKLHKGRWDDIPVLSADERNCVIAAARSLNMHSNEGAAKHVFHEALAAGDFDSGESPLDAFDERGDVIELLERHGWRLKFRRGDAYYFQRPGKDGPGISATYNYIPGRFFVFTSSSDFRQDTVYKPSALFAFLECGGDFRIACKRLLAQGYGKAKVYKRAEYSPVLVERAPLVVTDAGQHKEDVDAFIRQCLYKNELGDADLFVLLGRGKFVYDSTKESWFVFAPDPSFAHWREDRARSVYTQCSRMLTEAYEAFGHKERVREEELKLEYDEAIRLENRERAKSVGGEMKMRSKSIKLVEKRCDQLRQVSRIRNILTFASSGTDNLAIFGDEWDRDPWLLGVKNGVIDLRVGSAVRFRPAKPDDYIRKASSTEWKGENQACPRFMQFLAEVFGEPQDTEYEGDRPISEFVLRLLGYGLTGLNTEHIYPIFWGADGRNGKDTLLETVRAILGPDIANSVNNDVAIAARSRSNGQAQPELYDLWGMRIAWVSETQEADKLNAAQLKMLSGGGTIKCRPLHGNMVSFEPTHLLLLITNFKPQAPAEDQALWERIALIPFLRRFIDEPDPDNPMESKADPYLKSALLQEASGILRLLVYYCGVWQERGLKKPPEVKAATQEYRDEMDGFGGWLEECVDLTDPMGRTAFADLYHSYTEHCAKIGIRRPISTQAFGRKLGGMANVRKARITTGIFYDGLSIHVKSKSSLFHSN